MIGKRWVSDLALFGGTPCFEEKLHVGRPNIGNKSAILERMAQILDRAWLTNGGPCVQEFESRIAQMLGVKHCISMCNATVALEIAIRALGLSGEVIIPSFTFVATAHALQWQEITPVFCDIDSKTHGIDPARVESMITPKTTGIIGVHVWGVPCAVDALQEIADRRGLKLMFDAAHAFYCSSQGRMVGNFGAAEVFSFHATKFLNTFEGGAVVTNDDALAAKIRLMKNFGFSGYDNVIYVGTNGKMSEPCAAMGLAGLDCLDDFVARNRLNHRSYLRELEGIPGISVMTYPEEERMNYQYVVVDFDEQQAGLSRDLLVQLLHAENVIARRYFTPGCHRMEPYRSLFPHAHLLLPETENACARVMTLPTGIAIDDSEIIRISALIRFMIAHASKILQRRDCVPA